MQPPLPLIGRRLNRTLHGRSKFRPEDVPGHNVFRGYNTPGVGDGVDWFAHEGTVVRAIGPCEQVRHYGDGTKKEVVYLQGKDFVAVYAHINARYGGTGHTFAEGEPVGHVSGSLNDPHLHFELEVNGRICAGPTPQAFHEAALRALAQPLVYVAGTARRGVRCCLHDGRLYVEPRAFAAALGLMAYKDGDTLKVSDPDRSRFSGVFSVTTTELDEPNIAWARAVDILKPARIAFTWQASAKRLLI